MNHCFYKGDSQQTFQMANTIDLIDVDLVRDDFVALGRCIATSEFPTDYIFCYSQYAVDLGFELNLPTLAYSDDLTEALNEFTSRHSEE